jgi:lysophospholipase L1-like esterase
LRNPAYAARYVLIQFGHNDQPGKPGRSTDLQTEFPANLRRYVEEARAAGAVPVLVTPLTRRMFRAGKLQNDLIPWADATRRVAAALRVPVLDLNAESAAAVQAMGALEATGLAELPPSPEVRAAAAAGSTIPSSTGVPPQAAATAPAAQADTAVEPLGQAKLAFDYTHLGPRGADYFSAMVTRLLARAVPELRRELIP